MRGAAEASMPSKVGPYRIEQRLGVGGMGEVYRAWDERLGRKVALKQIRAQRAEHPQVHRRFLREARAAAALNHPGIVKVHDFLEDEGSDWIVMEYAEGETIAEKLSAGPLSARFSLEIAIEIATALAVAHSASIVHRDLKSRNVIITKTGRIKILDFGLAKRIDTFDPSTSSTGASADISLEGQVLGTPHTMSPEQARGHKTDHRTDLFALGVLLYEMVTGTSPFKADSLGEVLLRVCTQHQAPASELEPQIPAELSDLIDRLLEKQADHRPQTANEVADALQRLDISPSAGDASRHPSTGQVASEGALTIGDKTLEGSEGRAATTATGERRQVTVLCCELSNNPDQPAPDLETIFEAMPRFETLVRRVVEQFEGTITNILGQRCTACFGYPRSHEDDAQRAVRAALMIRDRLPESGLPMATAFAVQAGVHTGPAVVLAGVIDGQDQLALGATLEAASELQQACPPNQALVSRVTHRLVTKAFSAQPFDAVSDGTGSEIEALRIDTPLEDSSSQWQQNTAITPFVGRELELDILWDCWQRASLGAGQAVLVRGEAGIGKSRLVRAISDRLDGHGPLCLNSSSSTYTRNSPFHLIADAFQDFFELDPDLPGAAQNIEAKLAKYGLEPEKALPVLASLFSFDIDGRHSLPALSPDALRQRTFELIEALIRGMTKTRPVFWILEDLHWVDSSSLELLERLIEHTADARLLLLMTSRLEFQEAWASLNLTRINLSRLAKTEAEQLIDHVTHGKALPDELTRQIFAKTDGIPLFVEELTKNILESGLLKEEADRFTLVRSIDSLDIPATLRESLTARLDRLGTAKDIAQLAAVIGREFSLKLLETVSTFTAEELKSGLDRLVNAELVQRKGFSSRRRYQFRHALIQDAAYESLLKPHRRDLHRSIATTIKEDLHDLVDRQPELLAHHYEEADLGEKAIEYRQLAGQRASEHSAHAEAVAHFNKGLDSLLELPASTERNQKELNLRLDLGLSFKVIKGYAAEEMDTTYSRLEELCAEEGTAQEFESLFGLWLTNLAGGNREQSIDISQKLLEITSHRQDAEESLLAGNVHTITEFLCGDFKSLPEAFSEQMAAIVTVNKDSYVNRFGDETIIVPHCYALWHATLSGRFDQKLEIHKNLSDLVKDARPYAIALSELFYGIMSCHMDDPHQTLRHAELTIELSKQENFWLTFNHGSCLWGWATTMIGNPEDGIPAIRKATNTHRDANYYLVQSYWLALLTESYLEVNNLEGAADSLTEAFEISQSTADLFYRAELHRLEGELMLASGEANGVEETFRKALKIAYDEGKGLLELRAAVSLFNFLSDQGRTSEARDILEATLGRLQEGSDTRPIQDARRLLADVTEAKP